MKRHHQRHESLRHKQVMWQVKESASEGPDDSARAQRAQKAQKARRA